MFGAFITKELDSKNRLMIPKKLREDLLSAGERKLAVMYLDGCLQIYPWKYWEMIMQKMLALSILDPDARKLQRVWGSKVEVCELDKEGRFTLTKSMKEKAGIEKETVIFGAFNRLEIWSRENWDNSDDEMPSPEEIGRIVNQKKEATGLF